MPGKVNPNKRTTSEAELRELVGAGKTFPQIAEQLGLNVQSLRQTCSTLGIRSAYRCSEGPDAKRGHQFFADFKQGRSMAEVAALHGTTRQNVHLALKRAGLPSSSRALVKFLLSNEAKAA